MRGTALAMRARRGSYYDDDNNKRIDKEEFLSLLLGERGC